MLKANGTANVIAASVAPADGNARMDSLPFCFTASRKSSKISESSSALKLEPRCAARPASTDSKSDLANPAIIIAATATPNITL